VEQVEQALWGEMAPAPQCGAGHLHARRLQPLLARPGGIYREVVFSTTPFPRISSTERSA
jgi:hypothetical protein